MLAIRCMDKEERDNFRLFSCFWYDGLPIYAVFDVQANLLEVC